MSDIYLVNEGEVTSLETETELPSAGTFGQDWIVVEADSAADALSMADAVDHEHSLGEIMSEWDGDAVDALAWHLYSEHCEDSEADTVMAIRWGAPRTDGRSIDHVTGLEEAGISACLATETDNKWSVDDGTAATGGTIMQLVATGATAYLVSGEIAGTDSDGSVSLANVRKISALRWDSATKTMVAADA